MVNWNPFSRKNKRSAGDDSGNSGSVETPEVLETADSGNVETPEALETADSEPVRSAATTAAAGPPADSPGPPDMPSDEAAESPTQSGLFGRFRKALKKTVAVLNTDIRDLVGKEGRLVDDEFLDELFAHLVKTDMGAGPANKIRDRVGEEHRARKVTLEQLIDSAKSSIREIMAQEAPDLQMAASGPTVIMVVGVNGSGKTTSIAKLAYRFKNEGRKVVLGAGDTFRAAAVEQLTIWAERIGAEIITGEAKSDPASVAYRAVDFARKSQADICIVDTAGRLQTQRNLMDELTKIRNVIRKVIPEAPHEVLLVLDATAGQNALSQAKGFSEAAGCTGIVLAKLDGTAKGGVAIPIRQEFQLPVKLIGLGETPDALAPFHVDRYVDALFDLGES